MKSLLSTKRRTLGRVAACAALGLSLAAFGAPPALAGDAAGPLSSLGQILGTVDEDEYVDAEVPASNVEQEGIAGAWKLIGMASDEAGIEVDMSIVEMFGEDFSVEFDINDDGTFTMSMAEGGDSQSVEGTWEMTGADTASFEVDGDAIEMQIGDDGTIAMTDDGMTMTFGRADGVDAGKSEGKAAGNATFADPKGFAYSWELVALDLPGDEMDITEELFALLGAFGFQGTLDVAADGTFTLSISQGQNAEAEVVQGTWEATSDTVALFTSDGTDVKGEIKDGRLQLSDPSDSDGDTVLIFAAVDPDGDAETTGGAATDESGEQALLGEWYSDVVFGDDGESDPGADYELYVREDGVFELSYDDGADQDYLEGAWEYDADNDEAWFTANDESLLVFIEDGELYMDYDGKNFLIFVR